MTSKFSRAIERMRGTPSTESMLVNFSPSAPSKILKGELKDALKDLRAQLTLDDEHAATATALAMLEVAGEDALWAMRSAGTFRVSRYGFKEAAVMLAEAVVVVSPKLPLSAKAMKYLSSLAALHSLRHCLKDIDDAVFEELSRRREVALKSLLVLIDRAFIGNWQGGDTVLPGDDVHHYGNEDLAEAFSSIVETFRKRVGLEPIHWARTDTAEVLATDSDYMLMLLLVCRLNQYRRAETLIDGLPYDAVLADEKVTVSSTDPLLEKSIRLGYIQHSQQVWIRRSRLIESYRANPTTFQTVEELAKSLFHNGLSSFVRLEVEPERRLIFAIPADVGLESFLSFGDSFFEELVGLLQLDVDAFLDDSMWLEEVHDGVVVRDIMRIQRLFLFINHVFAQALSDIEDEEERDFLTVQSIIFVMKREAAKSLFSLALPAGLVDKVMDLLTLPQEGDYIDVQYAPLIEAGDYLVTSPALLSNSNLVRNIPVMQRLHKGWPIGKDPLVLALRDTLRAAGFLVAVEVAFPFGKDLDGDVVALRDGALFIFECKHAYHPCNVHELRNVYDHVSKATKQLSLRVPALCDSGHLSALLAKLGWKDHKVDAIHGAIVTSTRVLHGWRPDVYPIVQARELMNVISRGIINGPDGTFDFWEREHFAVSDLVAYLGGKTIISDQLESMQERTEIHPFGSRALVFDTWTFDPKAHTERLHARYRFTGKQDG